MSRMIPRCCPWRELAGLRQTIPTDSVTTGPPVMAGEPPADTSAPAPARLSTMRAGTLVGGAWHAVGELHHRLRWDVGAHGEPVVSSRRRWRLGLCGFALRRFGRRVGGNFGRMTKFITLS